MINPRPYKNQENLALKNTSEIMDEDSGDRNNNIYKIERRKKDRRKNQAASFEVFIKQKVEQYFVNLQGHDPIGLYDMLISEIERPFLEAVLQFSGNNQTKAAKALGVSRSTLRKKIDQYKILNPTNPD